MKLSIIILVFNEEASLEQAMHRLFTVDLGGVEKDGSLSNDGSRDGSQAIIQQLQDQIPIKAEITAAFLEKGDGSWRCRYFSRPARWKQARRPLGWMVMKRSTRSSAAGYSTGGDG